MDNYFLQLLTSKTKYVEHSGVNESERKKEHKISPLKPGLWLRSGDSVNSTKLNQVMKPVYKCIM